MKLRLANQTNSIRRNHMTRLSSLVLILAVAGAVGCAKTDASKDSSKSAAPEKSTIAAKSATEVSAVMKKPAEMMEDVETEEDFAQEVKSEITSDNLEAELDKLEAELAAPAE